MTTTWAINCGQVSTFMCSSKARKSEFNKIEVIWHIIDVKEHNINDKYQNLYGLVETIIPNLCVYVCVYVYT